jgi:hypothetical protein
MFATIKPSPGPAYIIAATIPSLLTSYLPWREKDGARFDLGHLIAFFAKSMQTHVDSGTTLYEVYPSSILSIKIFSSYTIAQTAIEPKLIT